MKWISVKDRLPKEGEAVLAYHITNYPKGYKNMQVCILYDDSVEMGGAKYPEISWANADCSFNAEDVTHWMELPDMP